MTKHKWHKEIKAWADGAEIEKWMLNDTWQRVGHPDWYEFENYRIKPQAKKWVGLSDDEIKELSHNNKSWMNAGGNLMFDWDYFARAIEQALKEKNYD